MAEFSDIITEATAISFDELPPLAIFAAAAAISHFQLRFRRQLIAASAMPPLFSSTPRRFHYGWLTPP
jgi:hypothetical protein